MARENGGKTMAGTMERVSESRSSATGSGSWNELAVGGGKLDYSILDALAGPVMFLDQNRRITFANRTARERFKLETLPTPCFAAFRGREGFCEPCAVGTLEPGRSTCFEVSSGGKHFRLSYHRLDRPVGDVWFVATAESSSPTARLDEEAVRRMKHRFNNFLAPMAGKAEIILFALQKKNYAKAEKAANDILEHAENTAALDALFDLEPAQESKSIAYYVT